MSTEMKSRELPVFEVNGTDEFYVLKNFLLATDVLALNIERGKSNNDNVIIFYVLNKDDKTKALVNLRKLYHVFKEYHYIIIREYGEFDLFNNFFLITGVLSLKVDYTKSIDGNGITFYVLNSKDKNKVLGRLRTLYKTFTKYRYIRIKEYGS